MSTKLETEPHLATACIDKKQQPQAPRDCFNRCLVDLENQTTQIGTLHEEIQQAIDHYQPAIENLSAQAAHHSAELRRWVCARLWDFLLRLDSFKEHQDRLMALRAIVVEIVAKSRLIAENMRSGEVIASVDKDELLALLKVPGL